LHPGGDRIFPGLLGNQQVAVGEGSHLRKMGHADHLCRCAQPFQARPDPLGHLPADPRVDLVEHHRPVSPPPRGGIAESEHDARKLPPGSRHGKGTHLLSRVGAEQELRLVESVCREGVRAGGSGNEFDPEFRGGQIHQGKLLLDRWSHPLCPLAPPPSQFLGLPYAILLLLPQLFPQPSLLFQRPLEPLPLLPDLRKHCQKARDVGPVFSLQAPDFA
jgi:hypothetical protein